MRVIAGTARSVPLRTVKGLDVRPTTDRTKETLFNILMPYVPYARFLDLYAGTGAIGIEALSRGAKEAVFVEQARVSQELIRENLAITKLADKAKVLSGDVNTVLPRLVFDEPFDLIFMDPPFDKGLEKKSLALLGELPLLAADGLVIVEASPKTDFSYLDEFGFLVYKERTYGMSRHLILQKKVQG